MPGRAVKLTGYREYWGWIVLCISGLASLVGPLGRQGNYVVDMAMLYDYRFMGIANLAPLLVAIVSLSLGILGLWNPQLMRRVVWLYIILWALVFMIVLTYLQVREHIVVFGALCSGASSTRDASAAIVPSLIWWAQLLSCLWVVQNTHNWGHE